MLITADTLAAIAGRPVNANMRSTALGLAMAGVGAGLARPVRLAHFLGQLSHEGEGWAYDREIWGPTAAQARYDIRTDLGNTAARDGDGFLYRGRGPIQITGKANYARFGAWARAMDPGAPDFVRDPDAVLSDPWEGLAPIWYWDRCGINRWADQGDLLAVTRAINGGTNGLADRRNRYVRASLVLLGFPATGVMAFQRAAGLAADGDPGPRTHDALHRAMTQALPVSFGPAPVRPKPKPAWLVALFRKLGA